MINLFCDAAPSPTLPISALMRLYFFPLLLIGISGIVAVIIAFRIAKKRKDDENNEKID